VQIEVQLIADLLDVARIAQGKLRFDFKECDVHRVIDKAARDVRLEIAERKLALRFNLQAMACCTTGDAVRLQQVISNLLRNAAKFTPAGGAITVHTFNEPGLLRVSVTDTGVGIAAEDVGRIFGAFEQAGVGASRQYGGLGLGLAISASIIIAHRGRIWAESDGPGHGATFHIALPVAMKPAGNGNGENIAATGSAPRRILVVEDHEPTRAALVQLLTSRGHTVQAAESVAAAHELAGAREFDMVVSDIALPDGDGHTLMRELRDRYGLPGIALSGYGMEEDLRRSSEAGFSAHLVKPVTLDDLEGALAALVNRCEVGVE
jgi:CheY-like chemotaxis protein